MKKIKNSLYTTIIFLIFIPNLLAQQVIREGVFTIDGGTYEITKMSNYSRYVIGNCDRSELIPNLDVVDGVPLELANTKIINKKELKKIAREALGKEMTGQLATAKEEILGSIYYRPDGTVIRVVFSVSENTILTLDDLIRVEEALKTRFKASLESVGNLHEHLYHINFAFEWDFGK